MCWQSTQILAGAFSPPCSVILLQSWVSITWLWWTSAPGQLSPVFFCITRLPEKLEIHHPSEAFDQRSEEASGICTAAMLRSAHVADFMQLPFGPLLMTWVGRRGQPSRVLGFPSVPSLCATGHCSHLCGTRQLRHGGTSCMMPPGLRVQAGQILPCLPAQTWPLSLSPVDWELFGDTVGQDQEEVLEREQRSPERP